MEPSKCLVPENTQRVWHFDLNQPLLAHLIESLKRSLPPCFCNAALKACFILIHFYLAIKASITKRREIQQESLAFADAEKKEKKSYLKSVMFWFLATFQNAFGYF